MKKRWLLLLPLVSVTLSGCSFLRRLLFGEETTSTPINYVYPTPVVQDDEPGKRSIIHYNNETYLPSVLGTTGKVPLPSIGEQRILVVPVQFKSSILQWNASETEEIRKCFFGQTEEVGWESVSSYYKKSSYEKLNLIGGVAPIFTSAYTKEQIEVLTDDTKNEPGPDEYIVNEFEASPLYSEYRKNYDTNGDGYIDSIAFIYREKIYATSSDMRWWAFVNTKTSPGNVANPVVNTYMWASYYFIKPYDKIDNPHGGSYDLDAHTYIHESGHLLGLDDYYCNTGDNFYDPSGGQEMHSHNIGDENIYSKLLMGWVDPYYVKINGSGSITTTLYASSYSPVSNAIVINDDWGSVSGFEHNPLNEYIIIEYYSPTVLNARDSLEYYAKDAKMFSISGFRIYHVDSRLVGYTKEATPKWAGRLDKIDPTYLNFIGASNTPSKPWSRLNTDYEIQNYKLLHMMQAGGVNTFKNGFKATDADLFTEGMTFEATSAFFPNGANFNNGQRVGYRISIGHCDAEQMFGEITITKI